MGPWRQGPRTARLPLTVSGSESLSIANCRAAGHCGVEKNHSGPTGRLPSLQSRLVPFQLPQYLCWVAVSTWCCCQCFRNLLQAPSFCSLGICFLHVLSLVENLWLQTGVSIPLPGPTRCDVLFQRFSSGSKLLSHPKPKVTCTPLNSGLRMPARGRAANPPLVCKGKIKFLLLKASCNTLPSVRPSASCLRYRCVQTSPTVPLCSLSDVQLLEDKSLYWCFLCRPQCLR